MFSYHIISYIYYITGYINIYIIVVHWLAAPTTLLQILFKTFLSTLSLYNMVYYILGFNYQHNPTNTKYKSTHLKLGIFYIDHLILTNKNIDRFQIDDEGKLIYWWGHNSSHKIWILSSTLHALFIGNYVLWIGSSVLKCSFVETWKTKEKGCDTFVLGVTYVVPCFGRPK